MKKLLIFFVIISAISFASCSQSEHSNPSTPAAVVTPGELVYTKHCKLCHGSKGDLGLSGAANLKISALNVGEITQVVTEGRKAMPAWKTQLTPEEIQLVANYVVTLRKN